MATITPNKTDSIEILPHSFVLHPDTVVGSAIDCRTKRAAVLFLYHGYVEAVADTNPGKFKIQVRPDTGEGTVKEHWITILELSSKGTTPDTEIMTATEPVGETVLACASTTGFVAEDLLYIQDTDGATPVVTTQTLSGAELDSEWAECQEIVTSVSINLIDGLVAAKDSSDVIWNDASKFVVSLDLNGIESLRVIWSHEGAAGANEHVKALAITYDSDTVA